MNTRHVNLFKAYQLFWQNYLNFKGNSSRTEYWWSFLWNWVIRIILLGWSLISLLKSGPDLQFKIGLGLLVIYSLAVLIPCISITVRRYRNAGISGYWVLFTYLLVYVLHIAAHYISGESFIILAFDNGCYILEFICIICAVILPLFPTKRN